MPQARAPFLPPPSTPHHLPLPMAPPSRPSNGAKEYITGDRAEPCGDAYSALFPNFLMPSSAPAPQPPSRGIAGDEVEPCVSAPFPIPAMASSCPAPRLLLFPPGMQTPLLFLQIRSGHVRM
uniref:Predicted protein n=1 Tax=Hordeum vulgare subsp. vulgare TaxID=112509 RepID=F2D412_HORVV|nr:predicted protein [Hordeum vulgare subsp. vulgare]